MSSFYKLFFGFFLLFSLSPLEAEERIELFADRVETTVSEDNTPLITELSGTVTIKSDDMELTCDTARIDHRTAEVIVSSPLVFRKSDLTIHAKSAHYFFSEETGNFSNAEYSYPPYYGRSEEVVREKGSYLLSQGFITTCNRLDAPHYRILCEQIELLPDQLKIRNVLVLLGKVPIFYFPFFTQSLRENAKPPFEMVPGVHRKIKKGVIFILNHPIGKEGGINRYEKLTIGTKGVGVGVGVEDLEESHRRVDIFTGLEYGDDALRTGMIAEFQKTYDRNRSFSIAWRWMQDDSVLYDFFSKDFAAKERNYNYLSFSQSFSSGAFAGGFLAENAQDPFLQIEKLPELYISYPHIPVGQWWAGTEFSLSRIELSNDLYTRFSGDISLTKPFAVPWGKLSPFIDIKSVHYFCCDKDQSNVAPGFGVRSVMLMTRHHKEVTEYLAPSFGVAVRYPSEKKPALLLEPSDSLPEGAYAELGLDWGLMKNHQMMVKTRLRSDYHFKEKDFFDTVFEYRAALSSRFSIEGQHLLHPSLGGGRENSNDLSFTTEHFSCSLGNRYVENGFDGLTASVVSRFGEWEAGTNVSWDLDRKAGNRHEFFVSRKIHCLFLRVSCVIGRENGLYFTLIPSLFAKSKFISHDSFVR
jgi:hypothetical protein